MFLMRAAEKTQFLFREINIRQIVVVVTFIAFYAVLNTFLTDYHLVCSDGQYCSQQSVSSSYIFGVILQNTVTLLNFIGNN